LLAAAPVAATPIGAELVLAADQFVITPGTRAADTARAHAHGDEARTIVAGYHWFTDWGRDTMISLEGLTLLTGRTAEARYILRTFAAHVKDGLIPNYFPDRENEGVYHTADAPGCTGNTCPDNHQVLTGTNCLGELHVGGGSGGGSIIPDCTNFMASSNAPNPDFTCNDWTSKEPSGSPWCGHSWPRQGSGLSWMSAAKDGGCAPCVKLTEMGGVTSACVGSAGGYGGFYCFEYKP
jgi:hypothetical protein